MKSKFLILFSSLLLLTACSDNDKENVKNNNEDDTESSSYSTIESYFGENIIFENVKNIEKLLSNEIDNENIRIDVSVNTKLDNDNSIEAIVSLSADKGNINDLNKELISNIEKKLSKYKKDNDIESIILEVKEFSTVLEESNDDYDYYKEKYDVLKTINIK